MHAYPIAQRLFLLIAAVSTLIAAGGCVTRGSYDEVVTERDELRKQASTLKTATLVLDTQLMLRDVEIAVLEREQEELADEVARWAVRGAIQMQLLADGLHLTLPHDVLFTSGAAQLSPEGIELVTELANEINEQPYQIAVLGFSDSVPVGPRLAEQFPTNWELAGARAASVVRVIQEAGVPASQLLAISRGDGQPIASNDTPEGRAQNRRIDVRIRPVTQ
jgi:chemotaxis protein MotB